MAKMILLDHPCYGIDVIDTQDAQEIEIVKKQGYLDKRILLTAPGLLKSCINAANFLTYLVSHDSNYCEVGELLVQLDRVICAATGRGMPYDVEEIDDEPPARVTCPDCGADIVNDGNCWYCENKPA